MKNYKMDYVKFGKVKSNFKEGKFKFNVMVKLMEDGEWKGGGSKVFSFEGNVKLYDGGSIVIEGESDDMMLIGCNDDREVFVENNGKVWEMI